MAKALFLSLPLHGHINPSLPLVRELVNRGEEVVYYAGETFGPRVADTGARHRAYRNACLTSLIELPVRTDELSWLLMRTSAEVLDAELPAFRAERPDYVITDSVAPWGQWAAAVLGVPVVTSVSTFAFNRHVMTWAAAHGVRPKSARLALSKIRHMVKAFALGRRLRRRYGVKGPGVMASVLGRSDLNIVYTSRHFQPRAETFDGRFRFVGPSMSRRAETIAFPWEALRHAVVVYVSLGTLFNRDVAFYRRCFEAFPGEDFQVVLSLGTNVARERLGVAPPNFIVQPYVPQLDVLQRTSVFVTHGGMNSVSESLYYGVPVIVIPQMGEQHIVGRRVEELGAGLCLPPEQATAERLRAAVRRLLSERRFRDQARAVSESFRSAGGVAAAADAILEKRR